jgi:hypothetical protein
MSYSAEILTVDQKKTSLSLLAYALSSHLDEGKQVMFHINLQFALNESSGFVVKKEESERTEEGSEESFLLDCLHCMYAFIGGSDCAEWERDGSSGRL